ncbi:siderophore-interacting protein [Leucobacter sp. OH1287]|uniref:siderophore-interacting protein n=1 Tax=Leucobacter sp. OH1287 TaxID=2491049 RepID=UPI000F5F11D7|nr:siderophore-interacting protein [Leucobacter sp. OH1287]RRD61029.1 siderophore-interacting protein [Leucobacter sp. OH1287]
MPISSLNITAAEIDQLLTMVREESDHHHDGEDHHHDGEDHTYAAVETPAGEAKNQLQRTYGKQGFRTLIVTRFEQRGKQLRRIWFKLGADSTLADWSAPNVAMRLEIPVQPEEFAGIDGTPETASRAYTVAEVSAETGEIAIDFVTHGSTSPVMRWLERVAVDDTIYTWAPQQHRVPLAGTKTVFIADATALPAALSILRTTPTELVAGLITSAPADELDHNYDFLEGVEVIMAGADPGQLANEFTARDWSGLESVWAAGETAEMKPLRTHTRKTLGFAKQNTQVYGYWKRGLTTTALDVNRMRQVRETLASGGDLSELERRFEEDGV